MAGDGHCHLATAWRTERSHKGVEFFDCPFSLSPGQLDALGKPFELGEGFLLVEWLGFALIGHESALDSARVRVVDPVLAAGSSPERNLVNVARLLAGDSTAASCVFSFSLFPLLINRALVLQR
jgi:hypothetical protein